MHKVPGSGEGIPPAPILRKMRIPLVQPARLTHRGLSEDVFTADLGLREVARSMAERRVGAVAVQTGDRLRGSLSERDIMERVVAGGLDLDKTRVGEVMTRNLVVARSKDSHEDGLGKMKK